MLYRDDALHVMHGVSYTLSGPMERQTGANKPFERSERQRAPSTCSHVEPQNTY